MEHMSGLHYGKILLLFLTPVLQANMKVIARHSIYPLQLGSMAYRR